MSSTYVLDACALVAYLSNEPGTEVVSALLQRAVDGDICIIMNKLNLLEVYYGVYREYGSAAAENMLSELMNTPVQVISDISDVVFREAGRLKAAYRISIADSIALAEAFTTNSSLVTSDHHEFDIIEQKEATKFTWIR